MDSLKGCAAVRSRGNEPLPIYAQVERLVVGATAASCAFALAAARRGESVFITSASTYLGEDICGEMRLWHEPDNQPLPTATLARALYPRPGRPVTPMHIKRSLDQAIYEAGIGFLYRACPVTLWRDRDGSTLGAVFATRAGLLAIRASSVFVASRNSGLFDAKIQGLNPFRGPPLCGRQTVLHTTLCEGDGADAAGLEPPQRPADITGVIEGEPYRLSARVYRLEADFGDGSLRALARARQSIIAGCHVPSTYLHQEAIRLAGLRDPVTALNSIEENAAELLGERPGAPSPATPPCLEHLDLPELDSCDVLVAGGGTAGAPAAIAAGRAGADIFLLEQNSLLGGVGTAGQIASYWCGNRVGFTSEMDAGVRKLEFDPTMRTRDSRWSIAAKAEWLRRECAAAGVTILSHALVAATRVESGRLRAVLVALPGHCGWISASAFVDATGSADLAAAAGAPVRVIGAGHMAVQGTGLAGMQPGRDYHNSDHSFSNETDPRDATAFYFTTRAKFKEHFDIGALIDSRERRQIIGDLELDPLDFLSGRRYPDTICVASSNFDSHGFTIHPVFMCKAPDKKRLWADVPFRALLPRGLERVIVTGLGMSAHRDALPVIRMQADVQNQGFAAGLIAASAARLDRDLRDLDLRAIQRELVAIGNLPERVLTDQDSFPLPDSEFEEAVSGGLDSYHGLAVIFSDPERAAPLLETALAEGTRTEEDRQRCALILGLMANQAAAKPLERFIDSQEWDAGWNFRGMHQFGMSLSAVDAVLIAIGRCGDARSWEVILAKANALLERSAGPDNLPEFSHCRAVAEATEALYPRFHDKRAASALAQLLQLPGMSGHAHSGLKDALRDLTPNPNENAPRNRSLCELHLARALYRCGDSGGLGRKILEAYAVDLRSAYARHAGAILAAPGSSCWINDPDGIQ